MKPIPYLEILVRTPLYLLFRDSITANFKMQGRKGGRKGCWWQWWQDEEDAGRNGGERKGGGGRGGGGGEEEEEVKGKLQGMAQWRNHNIFLRQHLYTLATFYPEPRP